MYMQLFLEELALLVSDTAIDGAALASLLAVSPAPANTPSHRTPKLVDEYLANPGAALSLPLRDEAWREVVVSHLKTLSAFTANDAAAVCEEQMNVAQAFVRLFSATSNYRSSLPLLYRILQDLWYWAKQVGEEKSMEEVARLVNRAFTACITDRSPMARSRKWGTLRVATLLFRIYFHLGQLNLCTNLLRAVDAAELPGVFPASDRCAYAFYQGRFHLLHDRYEAADRSLSLAWHLLCFYPNRLGSEIAVKRRLVLHFWIPAGIMSRGLKPPSMLLGDDGGPYTSPVRWLSLGAISSYRHWLATNEAALLALGTFAVWERLLSLVAIPQLVKHTLHIYQSMSPNPTRLPLQLVAVGAKGVFEEDEMACLLANSIARRSVRGYLSDGKRMLVLAQTSAFPRPSSYIPGAL